MHYFVFGVVCLAVGAVGGIAGYFWLISEANEQGRKNATYENLKRQAEEEAKWNKPTTY